MTLFCKKQVTLHSGGQSDWIVDCASGLGPCDLEGLATMAKIKLRQRGINFTHVMGIPRGGIPFAQAMSQYACAQEEGIANLLIVDDVFTTGTSMLEARRVHAPGYTSVQGLVIFNRAGGDLPNWITPLWTTDVPPC